MLDYFLAGQDGETDEMISGLRQIAIHIIGDAGYGIHESWRGGMGKSEQKPKADMMNYVEALGAVIDHLVPAAILPSWLFALPIMPQFVREIGSSKRRFETLTQEILQNERAQSASATRSHLRKNLMSTLITLSDAEKSPSTSLTEPQIAGNLFLFTVAGYDTTANSLAYGTTMLASEPRWQDWLFDEISQQDNLADYEAAFPRLVRTRAFMFETLRLFTPIVHIARLNPREQTIHTAHGPCMIPPGSQCYINGTALHCDPEVWGADAHVFNPTRWLDPNDESGLITPRKGSFLPWSGGPRVCPGMKMAQVEFVGVLSEVVGRCRVEFVGREGEGGEEARGRLRDVMRDSLSRLTLQMRRPGRCG